MTVLTVIYLLELMVPFVDPDKNDKVRYIF